MDQAVILLPGQVPQQRLALQRGVGRQRQIQPPDVHAVRAVADDVLIFDQAVRQRGLAHRALAEQHHLGVDVAARCLWRRCGADASETVDIDRVGRGPHQESRTIGTEDDGYRIMVSCELDHLQTYSRLPIPEPGCVICEPCGGDQTAVGGDGDRKRLFLMALQCPGACARFQVPDLDGLGFELSKI